MQIVIIIVNCANFVSGFVKIDGSSQLFPALLSMLIQIKQNHIHKKPTKKMQKNYYERLQFLIISHIRQKILERQYVFILLLHAHKLN